MSQSIIDQDNPWEVQNPKFERVEYNYVLLEFDEVENAEECVKQYYMDCGYNVVKLRGSSNKTKKQLREEFDFFDRAGVDFKEPGLPDFFAFRVFAELKFGEYNELKQEKVMHNFRFVEAKGENGGLRPNQLEWVCEHAHLPIDVAVAVEASQE